MPFVQENAAFLRISLRIYGIWILNLTVRILQKEERNGVGSVCFQLQRRRMIRQNKQPERLVQFFETAEHGAVNFFINQLDGANLVFRTALDRKSVV